MLNLYGEMLQNVLEYLFRFSMEQPMFRVAFVYPKLLKVTFTPNYMMMYQKDYIIFG